MNEISINSIEAINKEGGVCAFTGHRTVDPQSMKRLPELMDELIERLILSGFVEFRTGGAVGFDTLCALKVLEKKEKYATQRNIRLVLFLPCTEQYKKWNESFKRTYYYVLGHADEIIYVSETYSAGCMHKRNRALVDGTDLCVAYCGKESGGSHYTIECAKKAGIPVLNLCHTEQDQ